MYPVDSRWAAMVAGGSTTPTGGLQAWRGGTLLADALDVPGWSEQVSVDDRKVVSRLTFTAADPTASLASHPHATLGWAGQQVNARAGYRVQGADQTIPLGWWRIDSPTPDAPTWVTYGPSGTFVAVGSWPEAWPGTFYPGQAYPGPVTTLISGSGRQVRRGGQVSVSCSDLLTLLEDDLRSLTGPLTGGTVQSEVTRLIDGRIPVAATWTGVDGGHSVPANMTYPDNRLSAICDLLGTVGAVAWINRAGAFQPLPATSTGTDWVIPAGAVVSAPVIGSREGIFNLVIVTGTDEDGNDMRVSVAETSGLFSVHGPFGVTSKTFSNPLAKTLSALQATAATYLRQGIESRAVRFKITLTTPHWALDPLDRVSFTDPDGVTFAGAVVGLDRSPTGMSIDLVIPYAEVWPDVA